MSEETALTIKIQYTIDRGRILKIREESIVCETPGLV